MNAVHHSLKIPTAGVVLQADIAVPEPAQGIVLLTQASSSNRYRPRNRYVAAELLHAGLATVLVDLLTPHEEQIDALTAELRFDIDLLAVRLAGLTERLVEQEPTAHLGVGLFGANTGAAAALVAAGARLASVQAISRGGRPELAGEFLRLVHRPTLLIVGARDTAAIELNKMAMEKLSSRTRLESVQRRVALLHRIRVGQVARLARDWFARYLEPMPHDESRR